ILPVVAEQPPTKLKILALIERILLGEIPGALRVLAVNAGQHFHREGAKHAKKKLGDWIPCGCSSAASWPFVRRSPSIIRTPNRIIFALLAIRGFFLGGEPVTC